MAWQTQWGTVKAANAKAAALYYEVSNVGKTIESSKKRIIWRLKVEEGREFEISLTHSLASGKKVLRVDGIVRYTSQALSFGDWDYVFNLTGGHCVHIIIKPSMDLNDMYDLIIDGMSFRRLPERLNPNRVQTQTSGVTDATGARRVSLRGRSSNSRSNSATYRYSEGRYSNDGSRGSSRENSFGPWECTRCTLVNEKPLAPVCEACGHPKPEHISAEARERAKSVASTPQPPPSPPRPASKSAPEPPNMFAANWPDATEAESSTSTNTFNPFGESEGFPATAPVPAQMATQQSAHKMSHHDITSMLDGLDFTTVAPAEETIPPTEATPEPPTTDSVANSRDLWSSNMVDLNLKPGAKQHTPLTAKSYQTLEQARKLAPKEKVQVIPTPPAQTAYATYNAMQTPAGYYGGTPQHTMYSTAGGFGMAPAPMGLAGPQQNAMVPYGGFGGQQTSPSIPYGQQNGTTTTPLPPCFSSDPFATLS